MSDQGKNIYERQYSKEDQNLISEIGKFREVIIENYQNRAKSLISYYEALLSDPDPKIRKYAQNGLNLINQRNKEIEDFGA